MRIIFYLTFSFCLLVLSSCKSDEKNSVISSTSSNFTTEWSNDCPKYIAENKDNNLNISILLDLSDRITAHKIIEKDTAYLSSIAEAFTEHIKSKKLILLQDRIQLFFSPEPSNGAINEIARQLRIQFTRHSDCLLYTSPSPRDRSLSRMPSSA